MARNNAEVAAAVRKINLRRLSATKIARAKATGQIFIQAPLVNKIMAVIRRLCARATSPKTAKTVATESIRPMATGPRSARNASQNQAALKAVGAALPQPTSCPTAIIFSNAIMASQPFSKPEEPPISPASSIGTWATKG